jgi:hypothetical protein
MRRNLPRSFPEGSYGHPIPPHVPADTVNVHSSTGGRAGTELEGSST